MADTIIIKTTGGDIHVTPDETVSVSEYADKIRSAIDDPERSTDWLRLSVDGGQALIKTSSVTGIIARRARPKRTHGMT